MEVKHLTLCRNSNYCKGDGGGGGSGDHKRQKVTRQSREGKGNKERKQH